MQHTSLYRLLRYNKKHDEQVISSTKVAVPFIVARYPFGTEVKILVNDDKSKMELSSADNP